MAATTCLLVDGAVAHGSPFLHRIRDAGALALYADLGDNAAAVGPWLLPGAGLDHAGPCELPLRHGVSELQAQVGLDTVVAHLQGLRHLDTADGQRFYARVADMRALHPLHTVLSAPQRQVLLGPIDTWRCTNRYGEEQVLCRDPALPAPDSRPSLRLDHAQLAQLLSATLAEQLCAALVELQEPGLQPDTDARQFRLIEYHALPFLHAKGIEPSALQRAVARQFVLHGAAIAEDPRFGFAVEAARRSGTTDTLDAWSPRGTTLEAE